MSKECLPEHLRDALHDDWKWPLSYVPRAWSAFCGDGPVVHGWKDPIPVPDTKRWHLRDVDGSWRPYFAFTTKGGWHFRTGFRWDDVDKYYNLNLPFTFKRMFKENR